MKSSEYTKLKYAIANACNQSGLSPADIVGVLSAALAEAKEQMALELTVELLQAQGQLTEQEEPENAEHV